MSKQREDAPTPPRVTVRGMTLATLCERIGGDIVGDDGVLVTDVQQDSRLVRAGDLFVALTGARTDGLRHVSAAVAQGATAVLARSGAQIDADVPVLFHPEPRIAMANAASEVHGRPTEQLVVVGITGTNGKTTTAQLVAHALRGSGLQVGVIGTLGYDFGNRHIVGTHTSPEADALQRAAREMVDGGIEVLVMEVSSIALAADRVAATDFDVAVFTNLTQDHLDYHGTMAAYAEAKERLFTDHGPGTSVLNIDDAYGAELEQTLSGAYRGQRLITVSAGGGDARVRATRVAQSARGTTLDLMVDGVPSTLTAPLIGEHNAANLVTAIGIAHALRLPLGPVMATFRNAPSVPGRLERCDTERDDVLAVVDYAHTPDALTRALASLRPLTSGRVWCVFGCGGDRDRAKREPMGAAVSHGADIAIVTNDNPRSEDPQVIADAVVRGFDGDASDVVLDRAQAIEQAIRGAAAGDAILIAGKGHETYQIIGDERLDFDDREVVRAALKRRREG